MKESIAQILKRLNDNGYEAYLVGGSVRNYILDKDIDDYDINTSADPNAIRILFSDYPLYDIGRKLGTVAILIDNEKVEITPFRKEGKYSDHRHPEEISFSDQLEDDLKRRDFTINALCMDSNGTVIDLYNGIDDLHNKIIRTIGNPDERFDEDGLRILRALRFKSKLQFEIEEKTKESIFRNKDLLKEISAERKKDELFKILTCEDSFKVINEYLEVFRTFMDIDHIDKEENIFNDPLYALSYLYARNHFSLGELKLSGKETDIVKTLSSLTDTDLKDDYDFIRNLSNIYTDDCLRYLNCLYNTDYTERYTSLKPYIITLNDLDIDGNTLMDMSYSGKKISEVKQKLLDLVHQKKLSNHKEVLINYLKENSL
ncbi:MAG: hypothetical protein Q4D13_07460 [Erysipelotrichaceae bacterium]|nr:hypothetical protein [Erysipelotrichaceae bacterium]